MKIAYLEKLHRQLPALTLTDEKNAKDPHTLVNQAIMADFQRAKVGYTCDQQTDNEPLETTLEMMVSIDEQMRQGNYEDATSYNNLLLYHIILNAQINFIINHFDSLKENNYIQGIKLDYQRCYLDIKRHEVELAFEYVQAITPHLTNAIFNQKDKNEIHQEIMKTNQLIQQIIAGIKKTMAEMPADSVSSRFQFSFAQTQLEIAAYKVDTTPYNHHERLALGTQTLIDELRYFAANIEDPYYHVTIIHLEAKEIYLRELNYKEVLTLTTSALNTLENISTPNERLHRELKGGIITTLIDTTCKESARYLDSEPVIKMIRWAFQQAKCLTNTISECSAIVKAQFITSTYQLAFMLINNLKHQLARAHLDQMEVIKNIIDENKFIADLIASVNKKASNKKPDAYASNIVAQFNELEETISKKTKAINSAAERKQIKFEAAEQLIAEYNKNFNRIIAQFTQALQKKIKPKSKPSKPSRPFNPKDGEAEKSPKKPSPPSVAEICYQHYTKHPKNWNKDSMLALVPKEDHAQVLAYCGDYYLIDHQHDEALQCLEEALTLSTATEIKKPEILEGISTSLTITKTQITALRNESSRHADALEAQRETFIFNLGKEKTPGIAFLDDNQIKQDKKHYDQIMKTGQAAFAEIGEKKQSQHKPLSPETLDLRAARDEVKRCNNILKETNALSKKVNAEKPQHPPKLSNHSATLYGKKNPPSPNQSKKGNKHHRPAQKK
jgi:hypothetical protein